MKNTDVNKQIVRYRIIGEETNEQVFQVRDSTSAYEFIMKNVVDSSTLSVSEAFHAIYLDAKGHVKGFAKISDGGINNATADPRIIYYYAVTTLATAVILVHNHPSGDTQPSPDDRRLTKQLIQAGKLLNVHVHDHLIITKDKYRSFRDWGDMND